MPKSVPNLPRLEILMFSPEKLRPRGVALTCCLPLLLMAVVSKDVAAKDDSDATKDEQMPLEQVFVIGEKVERPYIETLSSVGIVTAEDLENYDIFDTQDAYRRLGNVRAFADDTGGNSISIRGLNADGVTQPSNSAALISVVIDGVTQSVEGLKRGSRGFCGISSV